MALKTRLEILENDLNSANEQMTEHEVNKILLERGITELPPGKEYDELKALLDVRMKNIAKVQKVIDIVKELIAKEAK